MQKKLTITVDADVHDGLHAVIGPRRISRFISDLARPHVVGKHLHAGYAAMAADEPRERAAAAWTEGTIGDVAAEPRPAMILSNDDANAVLNRLQVVPFSSSVAVRYPAEADVSHNGRRRKAMTDKITTVSVLRLRRRLGHLDRDDVAAVERVMRLQLGL
jgi:mRNA-degrading endonuclease toxin of MazEF toxin-antitoxin module